MMLYTKVVLKERNYTALLSEIFFNVATERACSAEFVRFDIPRSTDKNDQKAYPAALRIMKYAQKRKFIQIYLNDEMLAQSSTEALYIKNLYGDIIEDEIRPEGFDFIYVKL